MAIIAKNWRKQFQQVFHLVLKEERPVNKQWTLVELFPSLKKNLDNQEAVRISDCQHLRSKRPLRLLSSLLCLNSTHQHHIATSFVEHIVAALNGKVVDWPQEFYREMTEEIIALHVKHRATRLKMGKTSIGPHVTLILKAAGTLDIREEFEAGYRIPRALTIAEQVPHPQRKKIKAVKGPGSQPKLKVVTPPNLGVAEEPGSTSTHTAQVYAAMPQAAEETEELPLGRGMIPETTEKRQPPNSLPAMVEQICQAHRRLKNLLFSFTIKTPHALVNKMNNGFFKI
jgi:hypothetical protein